MKKSGCGLCWSSGVEGIGGRGFFPPFWGTPRTSLFEKLVKNFALIPVWSSIDV